MSDELFLKRLKATCGDGEMWPDVTVKIEKESSEDHQSYARPGQGEARRGDGAGRPPAWAEVEVELEDTNDGGSPPWDDATGAVTKTRVWWSDAETRVLLKLIQDINVGTILDGKRQRNAAVFKKIQRELSLRGVEKNWEAARWKWKALKAKYIAAKRAMGRGGAGTWTNFRFFSDMDKILGGRPNALRASAHLQDAPAEPSEEHAEAEECSDASQLPDVSLPVLPTGGASLDASPNPFGYESVAPERPAGSPPAPALAPLTPPFLAQPQPPPPPPPPACDFVSGHAASPSPRSSACSSPSASSAIIDTFAPPARAGAHPGAHPAAATAGRFRRHYQTRKLDSYMTDFRRMHDESVRAFRESEARDAACMHSLTRLMERAVACMEAGARPPPPPPPPSSNSEPFGSRPGE